MQTFLCIACLNVAKLWYITCFTILGAIQSFRWPLLFHGTLHSDLDVFACGFLLRHHNPGCCLVNRSSRCTLESDSTNKISLRSSFRTIRTVRNEETLNLGTSIWRKQLRRLALNSRRLTTCLLFQWRIHRNRSLQGS
jgi:hypothetical protein